MKEILLLSDTHGLLRDEVLEACERADAILHAGDLSEPAIVEMLQGYGELHVVRGNTDQGWAWYLPQTLTLEIEGLRFFMVHNKREVPKNLTDIDVVVYGHSHKFSAEVSDGVLWLNPGSCGKRRFDLDITFCRMVIERGRYQLERVLIPH